MLASPVLIFSLVAVLPVSAKIITRAVPDEHGGVKLEGWLACDDAKATAAYRGAGLNGSGYNPAADRRSWEHMRTFFAEIFAVRP